jgi:CheY-like chemotaxis protein
VTPANKTVLIVEDREGTREALLEILLSEGFAVAAAGNGQQALEYLGEHSLPALILLDLQMPVMDGWELVERLRTEPAYHAVPVVLLSGASTIPDEARALGVDGFLRKPVDIDVLLQVIRMYTR